MQLLGGSPSIRGAYHLLCGVDGHTCVQEGSVQEGHPRLHSEGERRLVGSEDIPLMQPHGLAHCLSAPDTRSVELAGHDCEEI